MRGRGEGGSRQRHSCSPPPRQNQSQPRHVTAVWPVGLRSHRLLYMVRVLGSRKIFPLKSTRKKGRRGITATPSHVGRAKSEYVARSLCWSSPCSPPLPSPPSYHTAASAAPPWVHSRPGGLQTFFGGRVKARWGRVEDGGRS